MEGLVPLILELVLPLGLLAGAALAAALALAGAAVELLLHLLSVRVAASALARRLRRGLLGAVAALALALILCQTLFFQPLVRRLARAARAKTNIALDFPRASGNLLQGRVVLHDARAVRDADPAATFDLRARELEIDLRLPDLLRGRVSIERVRLSGARGSYARVEGVERPPRKPYVADVLRVEDLELAWTLRRAGRPDFTLPLRVDELEIRPFQARDAAHSALFRSNGRGALAGAPFRVRHEDGRSTWEVDRLPLRLMSGFLGEPFDWLGEGAADVVVRDRWREDGDVELHWKVLVREPKAEVPERVTGLKRTMAQGFVKLVNAFRRDIPLDVPLTLKGEGFKGSLSLERLAVWDALSRALAGELAEAVGFNPETGVKGLEWLKRRRN